MYLQVVPDDVAVPQTGADSGDEERDPPADEHVVEAVHRAQGLRSQHLGSNQQLHEVWH